MVSGKDLKVNDQVIGPDGERLSVIEISKGIIRGRIHVSLSNGDWSEVHPNDSIQTLVRGKRVVLK